MGRNKLFSKYDFMWPPFLHTSATLYFMTGNRGRGEGVGLSRPFTQEEGKYKIQFVTAAPPLPATDEPMDRAILLLDHERVKFNVFVSSVDAVLRSGQRALWKMKLNNQHKTG